MIDVGTKRSDIKFSWKNLYAYNRELIERDARRYFFVEEPKELSVAGSWEMDVTAPLHPDFDMGIRNLGRISGEETKFYISGPDFKDTKPGDFLRLMEAFNIEITDKKETKASAKFVSKELTEAREKNARLIHWTLVDNRVKVKVISPDEVKQGYGEPDLKNVKIGEIIQFERFGFVRLDEIKDDELIFYFTHK
jgi:glutamyl-tRNA synthetase